MDFWVDIAFAVLLRTVKSKSSRATMRAAFLKLFMAIWIAFDSDDSFRKLVKEWCAELDAVS